MNSLEKNIRTGSKPVIYSIAAAFILFFASLIMQQTESPIANFFATIYLFPFHLEFSKSLSVFIAAIISTGIAFVFYCICSWNIKTKFGFYIVEIIIAYFVYTGAWYFVKTMGFAVQDIISVEKIIPGIIILLASIFFVCTLCTAHFLLTKEIYESEFIQESEAYQVDKRKIHEQQEKKKANAQLTKSKSNKITDKPSEAFAENEALGEKIRKNMKGVSINQTLSFDTNVMIKCPLLVKQLGDTHPIILSKQVFQELDKKKVDKEIGANARMAMRTIESIQKRNGDIEIVPVDESFLKDNGLSINSPDDVIVGSCLKHQTKGNNVLFISEDRGARITAKNAKLDVLYF